MISEQRCHYCNELNGPTPRDLRPYGPGGSWICFPCMTGTPERAAAAGQAFSTQLDAADAAGGGLSSLYTEGPQPGLAARPAQAPPSEEATK